VSAPLWHPSPNFGARRDGLRPELIVVHYTQMATAQAALERLCDPSSEVSAHYLIGRCGQVWQMVTEEARAWHAGAGSWQGRADVNSRSIGIELDNDGESPFPMAQMHALEGLLAAVRARWTIAPEGVIAHSDMAPQRKRDPGARFDWRGLARAGQSVWPEPGVEPGQTPFEDLLTRFGYPDLPESRAAFRLRFRPECPPEAPIDRIDLCRAAALAFGRWTGRDGPPPEGAPT
jgi:N-acetylmuramoyl-L-alanine amidase